MLDNFVKKIKNRSWLKILSWVALALMMVGSLIGIIFGIFNFVDKGTDNKGTSFSDSLQTKIEVQVDNDKSPEEQLKQVQDVASAITNQVKILGANQITVKSAIEPVQVGVSQEQNNIGAIYIYTEEKFPGYSIDFDSEEPSDIYSQKLKLFYALTNSYKWQLEDPKIFNEVSEEPVDDSGDSNTESKTQSSTIALANEQTPVKNFDTVYDLNTSKSKAEKDGYNVAFNLETTDKKNETWNLDNFQKQFTNVFDWDGETTRQEAVDNKTDTSDYKQPNEQIIFWKNRTGLINRLEIDAVIGWLSQVPNQNQLSPDQIRKIRNMYNALSDDDKKFADFAGNSTYGGLYILNQLQEANKLEYWTNNQSSNGSRTSNDPLLNLLNSFYNYVDSSKYKIDEYNYLYSWNFKELTLINQYFQPIDYANFFDYFSDNTDLDKDDLKAIKSQYKSEKFLDNQQTSSSSQLVDLINNLNDGSIQVPIINQYLNTEGTDNNNAKEIFNGINNFFEQSVTQYPTTVKKSITTLSAFNGTLVGLSALILIIGIIVSLIYRVPGFLSFITGALAFSLSLVMFTGLQMLFSVDTFIALFVNIIAMFVPFITSQNALRNAVKFKKLNLLNAFIYSLKNFIKVAFTVYVAMIIISLVFLFFGNYEIKGFGSMLILSSFANVVSCGFIYLIFYATTYWLIGTTWMQTMLPKKYVNIINEIDLSTFNDENMVINNQLSIMDKISLPFIKAFASNKWWTWVILGLFVVVGIVGCILLGTIGPGYSIYFKDSTELVLTFDKSNLDSINDLINKQLGNIDWVEKNLIQNAFGNENICQYELISRNPIQPSTVLGIIGKDSNNLLSISFRSTSDYMPMLLLHNAINCMLISFGFLAILSIITLNFVNFIPAFVLSCLTAITMFGFVGITRMPIDVNSIIVSCGLFAFSQMMIYTIYSNMKFEFNMKSRNSLKELFVFSYESTKNSFVIYSFLFVMFGVNALIMMIFTSESFVFNQLILFINTITSYFVISIGVPLLFSLGMMLRELYLREVVTNKRLRIKHKEYDKVDEQEIYGINRH